MENLVQKFVKCAKHTNIFQIPMNVIRYTSNHESEKYKAFNETQESWITFRAYALLYSMYTIAIFTIRVRYLSLHQHSMSESNVAMDIAHGVLELLLMVILWILVYIKRDGLGKGDYAIRVAPMDAETKQATFLKHALQYIFIIGVTVMIGLWLLMRVAVGRCDQYYSMQNNFRCNPSQDSGTLPIDSVVALMLIPLSACIVFRGTSFGVQLTSWFLTVAFIVSAGAFIRIDQTLIYLLIYTPTSFFLLYEGERQNRMIFQMTDRLSFILEENERLADETHANELRHMLGNVAHDLKTPLTSFITCMDMMGVTLDGFEENSQKSEMTAEQVRVNVSSLCDLLGSLKNASTFMTMAINRCLDFTRASKGMSLIPHPETFKLRHAMELPMRVITDMQSRLGVTLLPIPPYICTHVLSDLQWLQENILCLVSNGVKYTSTGEVEIRISLQNASELQFAGAEELDAGIYTSNKYTSSARLSRKDLSPLPEQSEQLNGVSRLHSVSNDQSGDIHGDLHDYDQARSVTIDFSDMVVQRIPGGVIFLSRMINRRGFQQSKKRSDKRGSSFLRFDVCDCGIGLAEESMLTIFNPFRQTQRMNGGVGLGLYSLAKRVQALGGYYGVTKRPDGQSGCRFFFGVPYIPDELTASLKEKPLSKSFMSMRADRKIAAAGNDSFMSTTNSVTVTSSSIEAAMRSAVNAASSHLHVLVVDDTVTVLKMVSMVLRRQGHLVETAQHGAEAVDKLELARLKNTPSFDLVLMDLQMPVMDGLEAIRRIRDGEHERQFSSLHTSDTVQNSLAVPDEREDKTERLVDMEASMDQLNSLHTSQKGRNFRRAVEHQCIVAMSANGDPTASAAAIQAGADKFICKPFTIELLNTVFQELSEAGKL